MCELIEHWFIGGNISQDGGFQGRKGVKHDYISENDKIALRGCTRTQIRKKIHFFPNNQQFAKFLPVLE